MTQQVLQISSRVASLRTVPGPGQTTARPDPHALELLKHSAAALARDSRNIPGSEGVAARSRLARMEVSLRTLCALSKRTALDPADHLIPAAMSVLSHRLAAQLAEARLVLLGVYGNARAEPQTRHANRGDLPFSRTSRDGNSLITEMATHLLACDGSKALLLTHFAASRGLPTADSVRSRPS